MVSVIMHCFEGPVANYKFFCRNFHSTKENCCIMSIFELLCEPKSLKRAVSVCTCYGNF